jgi:hypothetical protein
MVNHDYHVPTDHSTSDANDLGEVSSPFSIAKPFLYDLRDDVVDCSI